MRRGALFVALLPALMVSGSACAMTSGTQVPDCIVTGGEKLPAEASAEMICDAVRSALAGRSDTSPVKVVVLVASRSSLKATIKVGEKVLPEEELAVMDRNLTKRSIDRFAQRISEVVAAAS